MINKTKHPTNRYERRKLKAKKEYFAHKSEDKADAVGNKVPGTEEEIRNPVYQG